MPHYRIESQIGGRVAGVDEVGRGPLAGPVLAAAVLLGPRLPRGLGKLLDDSKALTAAEREEAYAALRAAQARKLVEIAIGAASVAEIVRVNIFHAAMLAMRRAIARLPAVPDHVLIDGNAAPRDLPCPHRCVVGGDATCYSIAAASIVAKVTRDRAMARLAGRFPGYGWEANAGYATPGHRAALLALGPSRHHRPTFASVRLILGAPDMPSDAD
jgi:ribonuclease HII